MPALLILAIGIVVLSAACDAVEALWGPRLDRWADWVFQLKGRR